MGNGDGWEMANGGRGSVCQRQRDGKGVVVCVGFFAASSGSTHYHLYQGNSEQVLDKSRDPDGGIAPAKTRIKAYQTKA